jgi:SAM-dependent methyltransferase
MSKSNLTRFDIFLSVTTVSLETMSRSRSTHWTRGAFVDHSSYYAEVLRATIPQAAPQVEGIRKILATAGVGPRSRILDIACGIGRHIVLLGIAGYEVVGCDLSPGYIREARRWARDEHLTPARARFYVADYRAISGTLRRAKEVTFDAAICIAASMGYYGKRADRAVLRAVRRLVRPGGVMIFETVDRDSALRRFSEFGISRYPGNLEVHERRRFDREDSTIHSVWTFYRRGPGGHLRSLFETEMSVRIYSLHELIEVFHEAGWGYLKSYGNLATLEPVSSESLHVVIVGQRPHSGVR